MKKRIFSSAFTPPLHSPHEDNISLKNMNSQKVSRYDCPFLQVPPRHHQYYHGYVCPEDNRVKSSAASFQPHLAQIQATNCDVLKYRPDTIPANPQSWIQEHVKLWFRWCMDEFSLNEEALENDANYSMNGKALMVLKKEDFKDRFPKNGDLLFNVFNNLRNCEPPHYSIWPTGPLKHEKWPLIRDFRNFYEEFPEEIFQQRLGAIIPATNTKLPESLDNPVRNRSETFVPRRNKQPPEAHTHESKEMCGIGSPELPPSTTSPQHVSPQGPCLVSADQESSHGQDGGSEKHRKYARMADSTTCVNQSKEMHGIISSPEMRPNTTSPPHISPQLPSTSSDQETNSENEGISEMYRKYARMVDSTASINQTEGKCNEEFKMFLKDSKRIEALKYLLKQNHECASAINVPNKERKPTIFEHISKGPKRNKNPISRPADRTKPKIEDASSLCEDYDRVDCGRILWNFLHTLLDHPKEYGRLIYWENRKKRIFKILDPQGLSKLWGVQKNIPSMNFDKMSRSLRNYYQNNVLKRETDHKHCYKFLRTKKQLQTHKLKELEKLPIAEDESEDEFEEVSQVSPGSFSSMDQNTQESLHSTDEDDRESLEPIYSEAIDLSEEA